MKKSSRQHGGRGQGENKPHTPQQGATRHGAKPIHNAKQPNNVQQRKLAGAHQQDKPGQQPTRHKVRPTPPRYQQNDLEQNPMRQSGKPAPDAKQTRQPQSPAKEQDWRQSSLTSRASNPPRRPREQLLHGLHAVQAAWLNPQRHCHQLWLTAAAAASFAPVLAAASAAGLRRPAPQTVERTTLDSMLPGAVHQGIALDAAPLPETSLEALLATEPRLLLLLDQVTDPHNVGAILRSAAAFGADAVLLTDRHAPGQGGVLAKTASGALEHVPLITVVNLARTLESLRAAGFWCIGLAEEGGQDIAAQDLSGKTALVLGAEGEGLRRLTRERCDALAKLPTQGAIASLNVSNAAAVALYEVRRQIGHHTERKSS